MVQLSMKLIGCSKMSVIVNLFPSVTKDIFDKNSSKHTFLIGVKQLFCVTDPLLSLEFFHRSALVISVNAKVGF